VSSVAGGISKLLFQGLALNTLDGCNPNWIIGKQRALSVDLSQRARSAWIQPSTALPARCLVSASSSARIASKTGL
jgi:hypothetical protein